MDILLTWVGSCDPHWDNPRTKKREPGPIISLLTGRHFDVVYLLLNLDRRGEFPERATQLQRSCATQFPDTILRQQPVDLVSVTDYREVFRVTNDVCQQIVHQEQDDPKFFVYLSPGTPQMQTVWILLVQPGLLQARLLDATPPDLVPPGTRHWREVELSLQDFPQIVNPGETSRLVGILQAQVDNLAAENRRLRTELDLVTAGGSSLTHGPIAEAFDLRHYLLAQERLLYVRALDQASGVGSDAARLLGIEPAAFRARAHTLGIKQREPRIQDAPT